MVPMSAWNPTLSTCVNGGALTNIHLRGNPDDLVRHSFFLGAFST
jgi:hypothetical protein